MCKYNNTVIMNHQKNLILMAMAVSGMPYAAGADVETVVKSEPKRPNLLYIFPDQYRLHALSLWGNPEYRNVLATQGDPVHTPNLDKLAQSGIIFSQACSTQPISSPHRAMLMSGMYPSKNGVDMNCHLGRRQGLHEDIECFTDVLAKAGYETAYIGKTHWHRTEAVFDKDGNYVGTTETPGGHSIGPFDTYIPDGASRHGNKYWFQHLNDNHFNPLAYSNIPALVGGKKDGEKYRPHQFSVRHEADIIIDYLKNKDNQRDVGKPFSLIWAINPPHPPYFKLSDCDASVFEKYYKDMPDSELFVRKNSDMGARAGDYTAKGQKNLPMNARIYFSLIKSVDEEIGRVLACLEEIGEEDNTIVVFTSDHGEMMGSHKLTGKGVIYDESFLVPFLMRYPAKLTHRVEDLMFGSVDIMPTMLGIMGLSDMIPSSVMGYDYSDGILSGKFEKNKKPESALFLSGQSKGVRTYRYTYLVKKDGTYELYDNIKDPYQMNSIDLNSISASEADFLKSSLGMWLKKAEDPWSKSHVCETLIDY